MALYSVDLMLRSALGTPLRAETLWGHICWGIRYRSGNNALEKWLSRYDDGDPPLVLSDPCPSGFLPRPHVPLPPATSRAPDLEEAAMRKRLNRQRLLSQSIFERLQQNLSSQALADALYNRSATAPPAASQMSITQAGINRLTAGTEQPDGGTLYTTNATFYEPIPGSNHATFSVLVRSNESPETIGAWFDDGLSGGYGRDATTGKGALSVKSLRPVSAPEVTGANAVVLLGPAVPKPGDPYRGYFQTGIYSGRVGGDFAIGPMPDGSEQRQKYPVHHLSTGTVLICSENVPAFVGRIVARVHPFERIRHYGIGLTAPVKLDAALIEGAF